MFRPEKTEFSLKPQKKVRTTGTNEGNETRSVHHVRSQDERAGNRQVVGEETLVATYNLVKKGKENCDVDVSWRRG